MIGSRILGFGVFAISLLALHTAHAASPLPLLALPMVPATGDPAAAPATADPAASPSAQEPTAAETPAASDTSVPTDSAECVPECRPGYMCTRGQCVSRCNPPCAEGLECTESLSCVAPDGKPTAREPAIPPQTETASGGDRPRYHDGFYLQLALGLSAAGGEAKKFDTGFNDAEFAGGGPRLQVAVGMTVVPGLVIGGALGLEGHELRVKDNNDEMVFAADSDTLDLPVFADWYFMPDSGLHAQLAVGPTFASVKGDGVYFPESRFGGAGLTGLLGVGMEGYISSKWGLGALLQLQVHALKMEAVSGNEDYQMGYGSLALLFSGTYH